MRHLFTCGWVGFAALALGCSGGASGTGSTRGGGDGEEPGTAADNGSSSVTGSGDAAPGLAIGEPSTSAPAPAGPAGSGSGASAGTSVPVDPSLPAPVVTGTGDGSSSGGTQVAAGILTAGAWDDNRNFDRFLGYRSGLAAAQLPGILPITEAELKSAHQVWGTAPAPKHTLDISLIIDTTGSMGDEIAYLQQEFIALSNTIAERHPGAQQRWSLVLYKDVVDTYVSRWFDFRTDPEDFRAHLAAQSAGGGGDFPESPERGFEAAQQLSWRSDPDTAKLAFWVADAPHHDAKAAEMADSLRAMKQLGVHVYPVAASGVDDLTELSMREAAALTGGRYLFLTNDSGVGGDHKEPVIPCYFVTKLDSAISRMVDIELDGQYREPEASEILRNGGDPKDGACTLNSGETVLVF